MCKSIKKTKTVPVILGQRNYRAGLILVFSSPFRGPGPFFVDCALIYNGPEPLRSDPALPLLDWRLALFSAGEKSTNFPPLKA